MADRLPAPIEGGRYRIAELFSLPLGGTEQWISIRGGDRRKPLLLFLHGGPGMPLISVSPRYFLILEQYFVVVNWDQRGSGLSWAADIPDVDMNVERFVSDALELTEYLLERFQNPKLFLVGHSWGSALGTLAVKARPDLFYCYLGAGQVANMAENEQLEYQRLMEYATSAPRPMLVRQLQKMGEPPYPDADRSNALRTEYTLRNIEDYRAQGKYKKRILRTALRSPHYKLSDLSRYLGAHLRSVHTLWPKLVSTNLFELAPKLEIPCFYILGQYDLVVLPEISQRYIEQVQAPHKELIWFATGHSMQYEAPVLFQMTIKEKFSAYIPKHSSPTEKTRS